MPEIRFEAGEQDVAVLDGYCSARVADLKEAGHKIVKQTVSVANRFGESCRVARYSFEK